MKKKFKQNGLWKRSIRKLRRSWYDLVRRRISSHRLGVGIALGVFVSIAMPYGTHLTVALFFAWMLDVDKSATALGTLFNNPFTAVPLYVGAWKIGCSWLGANPHAWMPHEFNTDEMLQLFHAISQGILLPLIFGLLVLGIVSAVLVYFAAKISIDWMRSRKRVAHRSIESEEKVCPPNIPEES